jgi:enoyl-CoA hydratase
MDSIVLEMRGDIAVARMAHGKASTLDVEFCDMLVRTFDSLAASPVSAVVLTGTGGIFSAGVDLLRLQKGGAAYAERFVPLISVVVRALFTFPKPLVAAVNGHAVAGGCVMACTADHRMMARGPARIGVAELLVGVPFPTAPLEAVRHVVPPHLLQAVVYGALTYPPEQALVLGLVDELVDADHLVDEAVVVAERLAALPAEAFALTKRLLRAPALARIDAGAEHDREVERVWRDPATLERVRRYVENTFKRRDR